MRPAIGSRRRQPGTRQTIMAACYGDTQPCGTAMPPLISASAMSHQEKLSHGSRIKDSQFMACQLLKSVYICASLLSLDRRQESHRSFLLVSCPLGPCPSLSSGHNTEQIRSHFYPQSLHCLQFPCQKCPPSSSVFCVHKTFIG